MRGGSVAFYVFLYSLGFMFNTLHLLSGGLSIVLYLIYMGLMVWGIYLGFGTIGFLCSFWFTCAPHKQHPAETPHLEWQASCLQSLPVALLACDWFCHPFVCLC